MKDKLLSSNADSTNYSDHKLSDSLHHNSAKQSQCSMAYVANTSENFDNTPVTISPVVAAFIDLYQILNKNNLEQLSSIYHPQIIFVDPLHKTEGIDEFKAYFFNMYKQVNTIQFNIENVVEQERQACLFWQMPFQTTKLNHGKTISVNGMSLLKYQYPLLTQHPNGEKQNLISKTTNNKIIFHRDYYDAGQMLYENIPFLSKAIQFIKNRMVSS